MFKASHAWWSEGKKIFPQYFHQAKCVHWALSICHKFWMVILLFRHIQNHIVGVFCCIPHYYPHDMILNYNVLYNNLWYYIILYKIISYIIILFSLVVYIHIYIYILYLMYPICLITLVSFVIPVMLVLLPRRIPKEGADHEIRKQPMAGIPTTLTGWLCRTQSMDLWIIYG